LGTAPQAARIGPAALKRCEKKTLSFNNPEKTLPQYTDRGAPVTFQ
jgi:hypothetical protein